MTFDESEVYSMPGNTKPGRVVNQPSGTNPRARSATNSDGSNIWGFSLNRLVNNNENRRRVTRGLRNSQPSRRPNSQGGMEYGLVPQKYLKRKACVPSSPRSAPCGASVSSVSTASTEALTPPRHKYNANIGEHISSTKSPFQDTLIKSPFLDAQEISHIVLSERELDSLRSSFSRILLKRENGFRHYEKLPFVQDWKDVCMRVEKYDCTAAVRRFLYQWKLKSELFGTPDLKVTIGDLLPNLVRAGNIQLVPTRDLGGRAIVCMHFDPSVYASQEREVKKLLFYILSSALEDEETQLRGIVLIVWNAQLQSSPWGGLFDSFWSLWKSMNPAFRLDRLHYCMTGDSNSTSDSTFVTKESMEGQTVIRQHRGSLQECLHALFTFGIPVEALPLQKTTDHVRMEVDFHAKWTEWRNRTDSYHHQHHFRIVLVPNQRDILFGKHVSVNNGNVRFHQVIMANLDAFLTMDEAARSELCVEICEDLCLEDRRFLQPLEPTHGILWEEMPNKAAAQRIRDALCYLGTQVEGSRDENDQRATPTSRDMRDVQSLFLVKQCCNLVQCRDGFTPFCSENGSPLSSHWATN